MLNSKIITETPKTNDFLKFLPHLKLYLGFLLGLLLLSSDLFANGAIYSWNMQGATSLGEAKYTQIRNILGNRNGSPDVFCLQESGDIHSRFDGLIANRGGGYNDIYSLSPRDVNGYTVTNLTLPTAVNGELLNYYEGRYLDTNEQRNGLAIFVRGEILGTRVVTIPGQNRPVLLVLANVCGNISWYASVHINSGNSDSAQKRRIVQEAVNSILDYAALPLGGVAGPNNYPVNIIGDFNLNLNVQTPVNAGRGQYVGVNGNTRGDRKLDFLFTTNTGVQAQGEIVSNNGLSDHQIVCYGNLMAGGEAEEPDDEGDTSPSDAALITRSFVEALDAENFYNNGRIYYTGKTTFIPLENSKGVSGYHRVTYIVMEANINFDVDDFRNEIEEELVGWNSVTLASRANYLGRKVSFGRVNGGTITYTAAKLEALGFASEGGQAASSIVIDQNMNITAYSTNTISTDSIFKNRRSQDRISIPNLKDENDLSCVGDVFQCFNEKVNDRISSFKVGGFISQGAGSIALDPLPGTTVYLGETLDLSIRIPAPFNGTDLIANWRSEDESLVTVDNNGLVTANSTRTGNPIVRVVIVTTSGNYETLFPLTVSQREGKQIDFDLDDDNNALLPATRLGNQYTDFTVRTESNRRWPILFNTANPTSNDFDIGTPNQAYGGPGIGAGGVSNRVAQGNALVVSKNREVPNETEGTLIFDFNETVTINSIDLIDMKCGDSYISLFDAQNNRIANLEIPAYGVNSFGNFSVNTAEVSRMEVHLDCGGGITGFSYYVEESADTDRAIDINCLPVSFLTTIIGDDNIILLFENPGKTTISYSEKGANDFESVETRLVIEYIGNLQACTDYDVKTSITCANGKIKESEIYSFTTDDCAGFNKEDETKTLPIIDVFPNPVSDILAINYKSDIKQITIYDTVGKTIETISTNASGSSRLNVHQYVPGVYIMMSSGNGASSHQKFIVE